MLILTRVKKPTLTQPARLLAVVLYVIAFLAIGRFLQGSVPPSPDLSGLWFYAGIAALLLGTFLQEPYYATPADALLNGVALLITTLGLTLVGSRIPADSVELGRIALGLYAGVVIALASIAIGFKDEPASLVAYAAAASRGARILGGGAVLYSLVFFATAYAAFADSAARLAALYLAWIAFFHLAPVERLIAFVDQLRGTSSPFGVVEKILDPGLVVVRLRRGEVSAVGAQVGLGTPTRDGVIVGLTSLLGETRARVALATGTALRVGEVVKPKTEPLIPSVVGFADIGTNLSEIKIELVVRGASLGLEAGRLIEVNVADRPTLFQIVSAEIREEREPKYSRTPSRATATKLGRWSEQKSTFAREPWMPEPGSPARLVDAVDAPFDERYLGHIPKTAYGIGVKIHDAVTHNTAILGILGVGKTTLAWELIHRMLADGIKVVVLDITGRYAGHFSDLCPPTVQRDHEDAIQAQIAARLNDATIRGDEAGNVQEFRVAMQDLLARFMRGGSSLLILNPNRFEVSRMAMKPSFNNPNRALMLTRLSMVDVTQVITEGLLSLVQALPEPEDEKARVCVVLEEAHSLVPEWNATTRDEERESVNGSVRAILQGRKYGYGCLLVTQRTANVTKSILNQCNTIFGMRAYDATGTGFFENYVGEAHAKVLASLEDRQAVYFGRASTCDAPIVIQLNDAGAFRNGYWARVVEDVPRTPAFTDLGNAAQPRVAVQAEEPDPRPAASADDPLDLPFLIDDDDPFEDLDDDDDVPF